MSLFLCKQFCLSTVQGPGPRNESASQQGFSPRVSSCMTLKGMTSYYTVLKSIQQTFHFSHSSCVNSHRAPEEDRPSVIPTTDQDSTMAWPVPIFQIHSIIILANIISFYGIISVVIRISWKSSNSTKTYCYYFSNIRARRGCSFSAQLPLVALQNKTTVLWCSQLFSMSPVITVVTETKLCGDVIAVFLTTFFLPIYIYIYSESIAQL